MINYGISPNDPKYYFFTYNEFFIHGSKLDDDDMEEFMKNKLVIIDEVHTLKYKPVFSRESEKSEKKDDDEEEGKEKVVSLFAEMKTSRSVPSKISKLIVKACSYAKKVLLLSATPVLNRPDEIINAIAMIDGEKPMKFFQFIEQIYSNGNRKEDFEDYFKCKISYYFPSAEDESKYYPSVNDYNIEIKMPNDFYNEYYTLQKKEVGDIVAPKVNDELREDQYVQSLFFSGLRQAVNNIWGKGNPKLLWVQNRVLEDYKNGYKSLIYSSFKANKKNDKKVFMNHLIEFLNKKKIPYGIISGEESKNKRADVVNKYNKNEIYVLLITKAGGEGIDLKETHNVIIIEPYWNMEFIKQVKGRAIRYKSHMTLPKDLRYVNVYQLLLIKPDKIHKRDDMLSIDEILYRASKDKEQLLLSFIKKLSKLSIENVKEC
jgi:SNF2 family DNA or RNA helicase